MRLLDVFGPVSVPGYSQPVASAGFEDRAVYEVELKQPPDNPRKKFLQLLSQEVFDRVFHLPAGQVPTIADALGRSAGAGDIQAWFPTPARQAAVTGTVWSGALPVSDRDFLMVVDANTSASKANKDLSRDVTYRVAKQANGRIQARLRIVYRNEGAPSQINPYYAGYVRIYVPRGSQLHELDDTTPGNTAEGAPQVVSAGPAADAPYDVFNAVLSVDPRARQTLDITYDLPPSVAPDGAYRLTWVRQSGTIADRYTAEVAGHGHILEPGARVNTVDQELGRSGLRRWLHGRWLGRTLGA